MAQNIFALSDQDLEDFDQILSLETEEDMMRWALKRGFTPDSLRHEINSDPALQTAETEAFLSLFTKCYSEYQVTKNKTPAVAPSSPHP